MVSVQGQRYHLHRHWCGRFWCHDDCFARTRCWNEGGGAAIHFAAGFLDGFAIHRIGEPMADEGAELAEDILWHRARLHGKGYATGFPTTRWRTRLMEKNDSTVITSITTAAPCCCP